MNDKKIRALIDQCTDRTEKTEVDAGEIKRLVEARIGRADMNKAYDNTDNDVYAEKSRVVSKDKGGKLRFKVVFTAAAAAACVGIAATGVIFVRGGVGDNLFGAESGEDITLSGQTPDLDNGQEVSAAETVKSVHFAQPVQPVNPLTVRFLDGNEVELSDRQIFFKDEESCADILKLEKGELWFCGNGEKINVAEAAGDKSYYIYSYYNETSEREHKVILCNTTDPAECGYLEVFQSEVTGIKWMGGGKGCSIYEDENYPRITKEHKQWVYDALDDLGLVPYDRKLEDEIGELGKADFSNVVCIAEYLPRLNVRESDEGIVTVRLLDGIEFDFDSKANTQRITKKGNPAGVLELKDGELYFIGNGENINIAEAARDKPYYIYTYVNGDTGKEHKVVVSNTDIPKECGYFELYQVEGFKQMAEGRNCYKMQSAVAAEDYRDWVLKAFEELGLTVAAPSEENSEVNMSKDVLLSGTTTPIFNDSYDNPESSAETDSGESTAAETGSSIEDLTRLAASEPLPDGITLVEEFRLLDNSLIKFGKAEGGGKSHYSYGYNFDIADIFSSEGGRIYFTGNGEHADITDEIGEDRAYIYSYVHPDRNVVHYVAAGGWGDGFGYAEIYPDCDRDGWGCNGFNYMSDDSAEDISEDSESALMSHFKPWFVSALNELEIKRLSGGASDNNFSYMFSSY